MIHDDRSDSSSGRNPVRVGGDEVLEVREYVIDTPKDFLEYVHNRENSIIADDSLFKRYIEGQVCLHLHMGIWAAGRDRQRDCGDYCVVIGSAIRGEISLRDAHRWRSPAVGGRGCLNASPNVEHIIGNEQLMFVARVQFLKPP